MRVVMLVHNDWKIDSRVRREAEALAAVGHRVDVICRRVAETRSVEKHNGVIYHCIPFSRAASPRELIALLSIHTRVMLMDAARAIRGADRVSGWIALLRLVVFLSVGSALMVSLLPGIPIARVVTARQFPGGSRLLLARRGIKAAVRAVVAPLLQHLPYLHDCAYRCTETILALHPNVIHSHDLRTLSAGALAARRLKCRLVYDAHELETHTNYHTLPNFTKFWIARSERALSQRADAVVTVCDSIADWLRDNYHIRRPTVILNVPQLTPDYTPDPSAFARGDVRSELGLASDVSLAIYVGAVTVDRGMTICVRALAYLPDVHFAAVGPRYQITEAEMLKTARELGVSDRVHLVDPVPSETVVSFISTADCSIIPVQNVCLSYYFCLPNKLFESVMASVPVAAASLLELRRFLEQYDVGVLMDERDPAAVATAIRKILISPQKYRPPADVRRRIAEKYGWAAQREKLVVLYSQWAQDFGDGRVLGDHDVKGGKETTALNSSIKSDVWTVGRTHA
jgi:glycosyltransferase involved in cell wall biosynthesis